MEQIAETVTAEVTEAVTATVTEAVRSEEKAQVVRTGWQMGLSIQAISQLTGLTKEEINSIE